MSLWWTCQTPDKQQRERLITLIQTTCMQFYNSPSEDLIQAYRSKKQMSKITKNLDTWSENKSITWTPLGNTVWAPPPPFLKLSHSSCVKPPHEPVPLPRARERKDPPLPPPCVNHGRHSISRRMAGILLKSQTRMDGARLDPRAISVGQWQEH